MYTFAKCLLKHQDQSVNLIYAVQQCIVFLKLDSERTNPILNLCLTSGKWQKMYLAFFFWTFVQFMKATTSILGCFFEYQILQVTKLNNEGRHTSEIV